jgi:hypothetical protein
MWQDPDPGQYQLPAHKCNQENKKPKKAPARGAVKNIFA